MDNEITEAHWIEALHTAHVAESMFSQFVADHPAVASSPALAEKVEAAMFALNQVYQGIGEQMPLPKRAD